jgi:hypothetical protein
MTQTKSDHLEKYEAMGTADAAMQDYLVATFGAENAYYERYRTPPATEELAALRAAYNEACDAWRIAYRASVGLTETA